MPKDVQCIHKGSEHNYRQIFYPTMALLSLPDRKVHEKEIQETFLHVKREVKAIVEDEVDLIMNTPGLTGMISGKN